MIRSAILQGLKAIPVEIEIAMSNGRGLIIVGLGKAAVRESEVRLKHAIRSSGFKWPEMQITINLAPADIPKESAMLDLGLALSILEKSQQIEPAFQLVYAIGEIGLEGNLRRCLGAMLVAKMIPEKGTLIAPKDNVYELALLRQLSGANKTYEPHVVSTLVEAVKVVEKKESKLAQVKTSDLTSAFRSGLDFKHIKGQEEAKRAFEVAATGGHNILLHGPPGEGKTLLAKALPTILPRLTSREIIELTEIYSTKGELPNNAVVVERPYRSIHHTASRIAVLGGGAGFALPGEITLAHRGVLFLDELPEFGRGLLESLRQPIEDGVVHLARKGGTATYPCEFILVAAMNPCPCGYNGQFICSKCNRRISHNETSCVKCGSTKFNSQCKCTSSEIEKYKNKVSGPIRDRIDLVIEVEPLTPEEKFGGAKGASSKEIRSRVERARQIQAKRFEGTNIHVNSRIPAGQIERFCQLHESALSAMRDVVEHVPELSTRGYDKLLKISRTVADLNNSPVIYSKHIIEAAKLTGHQGVSDFLASRDEVIICASCGRQMGKKDNFCPGCGSPKPKQG